MDILFGASILASFLAGMVALFAPCCITVLLPTYIAAVLKEKKAVMKMTFIFFAGIATILVPIGLGAAGLAQLFKNFHQILYIAGGLFMLVLGILSIWGKSMALLPKRIMPKLDAGKSLSVFVLGVFSGAATSCCAPVLAGAMTLAVLSGSFWKAIAVTFSYVFGMTFPLFIAAYFYDRLHIDKSKLIKGKLWELRIWNKQIFVHSTNLITGIVFIGMGVLLLTLALTGSAFWSPHYQVSIGKMLNQGSLQIFNQLSQIPDMFWFVLLAALFLWLWHIAKQINRSNN